MTGAVSLLKLLAADLFKYVLTWSTRTCLSWRVTSLLSRLSLLSERRQRATQLVTGILGIAVLCTVPFPYFFSISLSFLCLSSRVFSWTLLFLASAWARILEGIPVVFFGYSQIATQSASWNESSDAAVLAESSSSSQPESCESMLASFPFSATVLTQEHSRSDSLSLQIQIQSTL